MGFIDNIFSKKEENIDIEEFLNNLDVEEESMYEDADAFVKPITLENETDKNLVIDEARKGNIILLNIQELSKRNAARLKDYITQIKTQIDQIDGDMARISQDRVIVTPSKVKIMKKKENM